MMAVGLNQSVLKIFKSANPWWREGCSIRFFAIFSEQYKPPILNEQEIDEILKNENLNELKSVCIKPATSSDSCSLLYDPVVEKFINYMMREGKKELARKTVEKAFTHIKHAQFRKYFKETDEEKKKDILLRPKDVFYKAMENATPVLSYMRIKRSGSWYKVPVGITEKQARTMALKWIREVCTYRCSGIPYHVRLARELLASANYEGRAVAKKIELHKLCESNKGYIHYWWA